jgi:hypothetical protein
MGKIARLGHQFCIMKHDVDEIKKIVSARQFIFNKLSGRDFLCFVFFLRRLMISVGNISHVNGNTGGVVMM